MSYPPYPYYPYPPHYGAYYAPPQEPAYGAPPAAAPGYPGPMAVPPQAKAASNAFFNFGNDRFMKGLMIGAAAAYLLHNEAVQRSAIKGAVNLWSSVQGNMEEIKERFRDAEAELHVETAEK